MTFAQSITSCFKKYVMFKGRASRSEFWYFMLLGFLIQLLPKGLMFLVKGNSGLQSVVLIAGMIAQLAILLPSLAVAVRRLHDINWSGWWLLAYYVILFITLAFIVVSKVIHQEMAMAIGAILFLIILLAYIIVLCRKGTIGENRFGHSQTG